MSSGNHIRTRSDRVAAIALPPGTIARALSSLRRGNVLLRALLALIAAVLMWLGTGASAPSFSYRIGYTPTRNIPSRVAFTVVNQEETEAQRSSALRSAVCIYQNNSQPLVELRQALKVKLLQVVTAQSFDGLDKSVWKEFLDQSSAKQSEPPESERLFKEVQLAFAEDKGLEKFEQLMRRAMSEFESFGLLKNLQHELREGSQTTIDVRPVDKHVNVDRVLLVNATSNIKTQLEQEFANHFQDKNRADLLARLVFTWIEPQLKNSTTLRIDQKASTLVRQEKVDGIPEVTTTYDKGSVLAVGGKPLSDRDLALLKRESTSYIAMLGAWDRVSLSLADAGMYLALYCLGGIYVLRRDPQIIRELNRYCMLLTLVVLTVLLSQVASRDQWPAQIIPLLLFAMTMAITCHQDVALMLSALLCLAVVLTQGLGLPDFVVFMATVSTSVAMTGHVRSRTKLISVGTCSGVVAVATSIGVFTLTEQPFSNQLVLFALWTGFCALLAGFVMVGLLPFVERLLHVQTDISLLELGDAANPLLQELARRAPGTYNHSLNVASMAEAAAEAIGAHGLLVRVGAYFHDIGKMLKPDYFVENQGLLLKDSEDKEREANSHESLMPAMSTLVIIAHVKDGADLARQHHLPQSIIDFIEQHHGTTLVEYFYQQEAKRSEEDPDGREIDETSFRYPGPKPQTKEAAVMMLADAVESASRTLDDPTPARIEHLVHDIAMKKLLDGQFDECVLTLKEVHLIEDSLNKTLNSVYHGRIKYPDQAVG